MGVVGLVSPLAMHILWLSGRLAMLGSIILRRLLKSTSFSALFLTVSITRPARRRLVKDFHSVALHSEECCLVSPPPDLDSRSLLLC